MEITNKISYWAVIPANVRYDKKLRNGAKLLFGEISSLANKEGYCWATNAYFAELYNIKDRAVRAWLLQLKKNGYIKIEDGAGKNRKIYITTAMTEIINVAQKDLLPGTKRPGNPAQKDQKSGTALLKNNTMNNKKEYTENSFLNIPGLTKEQAERRTVKFEEIFKKYPRQTKRRESLSMFLEMIDTNEKFHKLQQAVKRYANSYEVYKGRIMNFTNFLPDYEYWAKYTED